MRKIMNSSEKSMWVKKTEKMSLVEKCCFM